GRSSWDARSRAPPAARATNRGDDAAIAAPKGRRDRARRPSARWRRREFRGSRGSAGPLTSSLAIRRPSLGDTNALIERAFPCSALNRAQNEGGIRPVLQRVDGYERREG